ncbi:MAG: VWA domain-containing protein, partial [Planctomycetaceae bacterium]|nr:VWA domain-containing protein [Planctomycetaceae bacterium]
MTNNSDKRRAVPSAPLFAAAAFLLLPILSAFFAASACAGEIEPLRAALLTKELGDPRSPGNAKLVLGLPDAYSAPHIPVRARDFRVYVYPADLAPEQGRDDRYRAGGIYLWRSGGKVFLDARVLPEQEKEGPARVRVEFAPDGEVVAEGEAEGSSRYSSDLVDVVLAVDVSLSMKHNDPNKRRVAAARTFIEMARRGGGIGRVGLVTFNSSATLGSPLIPLGEGERLLAILDKVGAEGTTNLDAPLDMAMDELRGSRNPVVILLSDGKNEGHKYEDSHLDAARENVRVFSVGLSEQADHDLLREMADATDGIYFRAVTDDDLPEIYARLAAELGKRQLLQARRLDARSGSVSYPIDATVERLVGMVDGGARLGATGPEAGRPVNRALSSVYMGSPAQGEWEFTWENASPGVSVIALFGDTPFFLDVFPPQLRGDKFSVGATLAHGSRALTGGQVWVEPLPGVLPRRLQLFDDGRHNDGEANDGVYGAVVDMPNAPDQFDLVLRAAGRAWDKGDFVRQAAGMVIRSTEAPLGHAGIGGDIDFGVLFPGETGSAVAHIDLDAPSPRELLLDLAWSNGGSDWPDFSSSVSMDPGTRDFELEITVPATATPGDYRGGFSVSDGGELGDSAEARVRVGTVRFGTAGEMDMGTVPPGTFTSTVLRIPVDADKAAALRASTLGGDDVRLGDRPDRVDAGRSEITVEVIVSAPMGQPEGTYRGGVVLEAGPGRVEIPLVWRVVPYSARAEELAPIPGLPPPPELAGNDRPLPETPSFMPDIAVPERAPSEPVDSPWERTSQALRDPPSIPETPATRPSFDFSLPERAPAGGSFWSAWWLYILAALLLLLLLLLLLAYILYRLGKSALARFLLVSALANLLLLGIFVLLLSAADSVVPRTVPAVAVNLVENSEPVRTVELTDVEKDLIAFAGTDGAAAGGGSGSGLGEITFAESAASSASSGGELVSEKASTLPDGMEEGLALADARASQSAVPLDTDRSESSLQRRERRQERSREEEPTLEMPEMEEPPPDLSATPGAAPEVGEAEFQLQANEESDRPVWSDGVRPLQPLASDHGLLQVETAGMEKVAMDPTVSRVDPRGRRRNTRESSDATPEPRVQIADPVRDELQETAASGEAATGDPGVEEVRVGAVAAGVDIFGEKPGAVVPPGLSRLLDSNPDPMPRGISGQDTAEQAASRGGPRTQRGGSERSGASQPAPRGDVPGGGGEGGGDGLAATGAAGRNGGGRVGERRFDEGGGDEAGGGDGNDLLEGLGGPRLADAGRGGGASPNPFGGGSGDRAEFQPKNGSGGGNGMNRDGSLRSDRNGTGDDGPQPGDGIPGSLAGTGDGSGMDGRDRTGNGAQNGRGRGDAGLGEGRFDDMAGTSGLDGNGSSPGQGVTGNGAS